MRIQAAAPGRVGDFSPPEPTQPKNKKNNTPGVNQTAKTNLPKDTVEISPEKEKINSPATLKKHLPEIVGKGLLGGAVGAAGFAILGALTATPIGLAALAGFIFIGGASMAITAENRVETDTYMKAEDKCDYCDK